MIVDVNAFALMVERSQGNSIAQLTRDVLYGGVRSVEKCGGAVVGFMGDAFLALLDSAQETFLACVHIAKDLDEQCEYISGAQSQHPDSFWFSRGGPSLKIGIEYGFLDRSTVSSRFMGEQQLFVGSAINYASRIANDGYGNRCHIGPLAAENGLREYSLSEPKEAKGKEGESPYTYFELDLGDIWRAGDSEETYWG
jgi:hypothetical protein